ncbi:hypothetical protein N8506_02655 [Synechococcus sp. AH-601-N23]|nr:hypothetical protein [Synechococcus sp. AH-601-N23]
MENSGLLQGAKLQSSAFISQLSVAALIDQWDGTMGWNDQSASNFEFT